MCVCVCMSCAFVHLINIVVDHLNSLKFFYLFSAVVVVAAAATAVAVSVAAAQLKLIYRIKIVSVPRF